MPTTTRNWKWIEWAKAGQACAKGSVRTLKRHPRLLIRVCCPKQHWRGGKCHVGMMSIAGARPRGAKKFAGTTVTIPKAHLREDVREAKAMIKELQRGVKRDQAALKKSKARR